MSEQYDNPGSSNGLTICGPRINQLLDIDTSEIDPEYIGIREERTILRLWYGSTDDELAGVH